MPGPDLSNLPPNLPLDRLLDALPADSPILGELLAQTTFAPTSPEYLVNAPDADEEQGVAIATLANGNTIVIWNDFEAGWTNSGGQIHGQLLNAQGEAIGGEITLTSGSPVHFFEFEIAALDDGGFVIVWTTNVSEADGSEQAIMAQMFAADGTPTSSEFQVNTQPWYDQHWPDVAALEGGGFVVTWTDEAGDYFSAGDLYGWGIRAQIYSSTGDRVGTEIAVNTTTLEYQFYPTVAALESGGFVITWSDTSPASPQIDIRAQVFSATGEMISTELSMNSDSSVNQQHSDVVGTTDGGFTVIWRQFDSDTGLYSIRGQQFDSAVNAVGTGFVVTEDSVLLGSRPEIETMPDGGFVVTWDEGALGDEDVFVRAYHDWDDPWTDAMQVNDPTDAGRQLDAVVAPAGDGFIVAWLDCPGGGLVGEIEARSYDLILV